MTNDASAGPETLASENRRTFLKRMTALSLALAFAVTLPILKSATSLTPSTNSNQRLANWAKRR